MDDSKEQLQYVDISQLGKHNEMLMYNNPSFNAASHMRDRKYLTLGTVRPVY